MLVRTLKRFLRDESAATAIEYALLGTLIGVALVVTFVILGNSIQNLFGYGTGGATDTITSQAAKLP